jgi:hypothetical protein
MNPDAINLVIWFTSGAIVGGSSTLIFGALINSWRIRRANFDGWKQGWADAIRRYSITTSETNNQ